MEDALSSRHSYFFYPSALDNLNYLAVLNDKKEAADRTVQCYLSTPIEYDVDLYTTLIYIDR